MPWTGASWQVSSEQCVRTAGSRTKQALLFACPLCVGGSQVAQTCCVSHERVPCQPASSKAASDLA